jgi:hypothetical protein
MISLSMGNVADASTRSARRNLARYHLNQAHNLNQTALLAERDAIAIATAKIRMVAVFASHSAHMESVCLVVWKEPR